VRKVLGSAGISSAVDGTDDGTLWNGNEEDGNVRSECWKEEDTNCEDRDNDKLTGKFR